MDNLSAIINKRVIGITQPPLLIAELSGNHNQSLGRALSIVEAATKAGVEAIKLQTYTANTMTIDEKTKDFIIDDSNSLWCGDNLYELYQEAHTPWEWHQTIFEHCRDSGLICFSTPFDETAVDFLEKLDCPCYKIASFENNHLPLLKKVAATGKPVIMSTGMATLAEMDLAVRTLREAGCKELVLLKCTSTYPANPKDSNLLTIPHMRELFQCPVGLSDHTPGIGAAVASIALGAVAIEKHFTLSRSEGGVDAAFSLEPAEMKMLVEECKRAHEALGGIKYRPTENEINSLKFRRSIYITEDISQGETLSPENTRIIRPGYGLHPQHYGLILGKRVKQQAKRGTPLTWDLLLD